MKKFWLLGLIAVLCVSLVLVSCGTTPSETDSSATEDSASTEESETVERVLFDNLPEKDYEGKEVVILVEGDALETYRSVEIMPQESSYEALNKAVSERNDLVAERFNVEISEVRTTGSGDMVDKLRSNAMSGISEYDIVMPYMPDAASLSTEGYFYDLNTLENCHLTESYYDQRAVSELSVLGKNYFVTGDLSLLTLACTHVLEFNKDMIEERGLEDPYELVKSGKWTLDKFVEMCHDITADVDGEEGMGINDDYGFLVNGNFASSMFMSCGGRFSDKNSSDEPVIALGSESTTAIFDKIFNLINDESATGKIDSNSSSYFTSASALGKNIWVAATESVANKHALFRACAIIDIFDLGEYDCNFGILPCPKLNEAQDEYYSRVSTVYSSCAAIPVNVEDAEMSSIILDAMMQSSTDTTKQAYFSVILKERKLQDNDSEEMLDIIFNGRVYDLAYLYSFGSLGGFMDEIAFSGTNTFVSTWESIEGTVQTAINQVIAAFKVLD